MSQDTEKKVTAWALLDRKNIMWVGCDGGNHLEIFKSKSDAMKAIEEVSLKPQIVKVTISYKL